jgi:hypothetical protein
MRSVRLAAGLVGADPGTAVAGPVRSCRKRRLVQMARRPYSFLNFVFDQLTGEALIQF